MIHIHSFFPLFRFIMGFIALFAAGDGGFLSSFGDGGGAPPIDLGAEEGDGSEEQTTVETTTEGDGEPKEGEEAAGDKKAAAGEPAPDLAKPLSKESKKFLGELKQTNPAAWKELNSRIWSLNGLDKKIGEHFDGGLDEAIALKGNVETFLKEAEADDLGQIKEELSGFRTIDKQIMDANPAFIQNLPPEMQDGLFRMMPTFVEDWRGRDEDGYQRYFGGLVVATLRDTDFVKNLDMALWKLDEMGTDDPAVKKVHDLLSGNRKWINDLDTKAKTPAEKKTAAADDPVTQERKQVDREKLQLATNRVVTRFNQEFAPKFAKILKTVAAGADGKIPANVNKGEVILRAMKSLVNTLGQSVGKRVDQYVAGKDEEGAFKYLSTQVTEKRMTEAMTEAYRYLYRIGGGTKPTPNAGDKRDKDGKGAGENAVPGFVTINYDPKASSIDVAATTKLAQSMRMTYRQIVSQNKAVLRNGKRVTWPRDAQAEQ